MSRRTPTAAPDRTRLASPKAILTRLVSDGALLVPPSWSGRDGARLGTWSPDRRRVAALAIVSATVTGAILALVAGTGRPVSGTLLYVTLSVAALVFPAAITLQVVLGQVLVASLLLGQGVSALALSPAIASVVVTAELLAVVARLDTPIARDPGDALPRTGLAAVIGGSVFVAVAFVGALPGPSGLVAVGLASAACFLLAYRLAD